MPIGDLVLPIQMLVAMKLFLKYWSMLKKKNNRSREACVKLGWMNKDGSLHNDAPQIVSENYYIDKPDLSTRYS